ncbi:MAG TPA: ABC transporter substrate-binding protein [Ilumatobacter sp.]|nr:ABC transporter substrate-binding protein [Ilumatobacter sp.]
MGLVLAACGSDGGSSEPEPSSTGGSQQTSPTDDGAPESSTGGSQQTSPTDDGQSGPSSTGGSQQTTPPDDADVEGGRQNGEVLRIASPSPLLALNPAKGTAGYQQSMFLSPAYTPLFYRGPDGYEPGLALEWGYTDDTRTVFEMELRPGVKFSDGADFNAQALVDWLNYLQTAGNPSIANWTFESVEATGPMTVQITLAEPNPSFEFLWSSHHMPISPASPNALTDPTVLDTQTFGTGKWMIDPDETITGQTYVYVRNPYYWDPDDVDWDRVEVSVITDENAALNAMRTGEIDLMFGSRGTADVARDAGLIPYQQSMVLSQISLLDRRGELVPALSDLRVRQALNYAIDRPAVATLWYGDADHAASQLALPGTSAWSEEFEDFYPYDPERAKELLEEAGYGDGFDLTIWVNPTAPGYVEAAEIAAPYWQAIGVNADIHVTATPNEWATARDGRQIGALLLMNQLPEWYTPWIVQGTGGGVFDPFDSTDDELNTLISEAKNSDEGTRDAALVDVHRRLLELAWFVPMSYGDFIYIARPGLEGVGETFENPEYMTHLRVDQFWLG